MNKAVKNALLFGLGVYQISKERIEGFVEELQKDGDLTPEEGKKLVSEVVSNLDQEKERFAGEVENIVRRVLQEFNITSEAAEPKKQTKAKAKKATPTKKKSPSTKKKTTATK